MNKTLVAIFNSEDAAFEGLTALKELNRNGDITLYDSAVLASNKVGEATIVKGPENPLVGTFVGMFVGTLAGALAGPLGIPLGAAAGTLAGATGDAVKDTVDYNFVEQVRDEMAPGTVALIADIEETWVTPVNVAIAQIGGTVFRRLRHEIVEDQLAREHAEFEQELKELKAELATSTGNAKAQVQLRIASLEKSLAQNRALAQARAKKLESEWQAKRQAMEKQLHDANALRKARIKDQMEKAKQDYNARSAKLREAQKLVVEAFKP